MWELIKIKTENDSTACTHSLLAGQELYVGRKDTAILILNDASISRKHAFFKVKHSLLNMSDPSKVAQLFVVDCGSKYGTCINDVAVEASKESQVNHNDVLTFGRLGSTFRVNYKPLIIVTSCLDPSSKNELKSSLLKLGGHLVPEWREDCTHLVMSNIKITIKTICALAALKYIVTPDYFKQYILYAQKNKECPDPERFISPLQEPSIDGTKVSFHAVPSRKTLFTDKLFICLSQKQFKKLSPAILQAGGRCIVLNDNEPLNEELLVMDDTCVMQAEMGSQESQSQAVWSSHLTDVIELLERNNKRFIPEADLGLAVVYSSTQKYCNPSVDPGLTSASSSRLKTQSLSRSEEVLVPETEAYSQDGNGVFKLPSRPPASVKEPATIFDKLINGNKGSSSKVSVDLSTPSLSSSEPMSTMFQFIKPKMSSKRAAEPEPEERPAKLLKIQGKENISQALESLKVQDSPEIETNNINSCRSEELFIQAKTNPSLPSLSIFSNSNNVSNSFTSSSNANISVNGEKQFLSSNSIKSEASYTNESGLAKTKVEFLSLTKPQVHNNKPTNISCGVNFKKFQKVQPVITRVLPQIIGGSDLISHFAATTNIDEWVEAHPEAYHNNEQDSADDMEFFHFGGLTKNRKRKR